MQKRVPEEYGFIFIKDNAVLGRKVGIIGCDRYALQRIAPKVWALYVRYRVGYAGMGNFFGYGKRCSRIRHVRSMTCTCGYADMSGIFVRYMVAYAAFFKVVFVYFNGDEPRKSCLSA